MNEPRPENNSNAEFQDDLQSALKCLKGGGIILYPTDTIWGLGCDARNSEAVKRIYQLKKRSDSKSMLVLVNNESVLERIVEKVPDVAWQLLEAAVKPLTIIYDGATGVANELIAEDGSLGIRIPKDNFTSQLTKRFGGPIVSTSANISGQSSASSFSDISEEIKEGVDYIVKYNQNDTAKAQPSNIIKLDNSGRVRIIR